MLIYKFDCILVFKDPFGAYLAMQGWLIHYIDTKTVEGIRADFRKLEERQWGMSKDVQIVDKGLAAVEHSVADVEKAVVTQVAAVERAMDYKVSETTDSKPPCMPLEYSCSPASCYSNGWHAKHVSYDMYISLAPSAVLGRVPRR